MNDAGQTKAAIETWEISIRVHPYDRDSLAALLNYLEESGDGAKALIYAQHLRELELKNRNSGLHPMQKGPVERERG